MDLDDLKQKLKTEAARLGFSLFGVTTPEPPEHWEVFKGWLEAGHYTGMTYLNRQDTLLKRADPSLLHQGCRSIICLGFPYPLVQSDSNFQVASYARMEDYHALFPRLLAPLLELITRNSSEYVHSVVFTDSAPILERELANRAGLGWIGKNSCLFSPTEGSAFLLAEIFTTLELPPDPPFTQDRCGMCERCVQACPTGCILPDRTIDAAKCISYLTIENKNDIPVEMRGSIGNWIFGCDRCQQVCPWNSKNQGDDSLYQEMISNESILEMIRMSDEEFKSHFFQNPIRRVEYRGFLRNIVVAMGNSRDRSHLPLLDHINSTVNDPVIQELTRWAKNNILPDL